MVKHSSNYGLIFVVISIFLLDVISKALTVNFLPSTAEYPGYPYGGLGVFSDFQGINFSLVYATNYGAAWGLFSDHQLLLLVARIAMIIGLTVYTVFFNRNRAYDFPLALIIVGATCNVIDYFIYGHVIDMFKFVFWGYHYPVFNVADSAICIGVFWFILTSWISAKDENSKEA